MTNIRRLRYLLPTAAFVLLLSGCGLQQVQPSSSASPTAAPSAQPTAAPAPTISVSGGPIAATIDGGSIPMSRFKAFLKYAAGQSQGATPTSVLAKQYVNQLLQYEFIIQYAKAHGLSVSSSQLSKAVKTQFSQGGGQQAFMARLKPYGLTAGDVKFTSEVSLLVPKIAAKVEPLKKNGPIATAKHILIAPGKNKCTSKTLTTAGAKALATQLLTEIKQGKKTFAAVAKKCSTDTSSAVHGGMLSNSTTPTSNVLYPGSFVPPFDHAVFYGPVNTPHIVKSQFGYHIVDVTSRHNGKYPLTVSQQLQGVAFQAWLTSQVAHAKKHIYESVK